MKLFIFTMTFLGTVSALKAETHVQGYERRDGTYVQPYYRTDPNNTRMDNYSTRGNVNPYTGKAGTQNPYSERSNSNSGYSNYSNRSDDE